MTNGDRKRERLQDDNCNTCPHLPKSSRRDNQSPNQIECGEPKVMKNKSELTNEKAILEAKEAGLMKEKSELTNEKAKLEVELKKEKVKLESENSERMKEKAELMKEKAKLEAKEAELMKEKAKLEAKEAELMKEKAKLEAKEAELMKEKADLQESENKLNDQLCLLLDTAGSKDATQNIRVELLRKRILSTAEDRRINGLQLESVGKQLESIGKQLESIGKQLESIGKQLESIGKQLESIGKRMEEVTKQQTILLSQINPPGESVSWMRDESAEMLAKELLSLPERCLGHGVSAIDLTSGLGREDDQSTKLLLRKDTRGVVRAIYDWCKHEKSACRAVLLGSPGIGKSRSLVLVIRELMRHEEERILYADRNEMRYTRFERQTDGSYHAHSIESESIEIVLTMGNNDWVLVDPKEKENDIHFAKGKLILAASPNRKHFLNWGKRNAKYFHLGMCSMDELLAMAEELNDEKADIAVLRDRFLYVGGSPRYVFSQEKFEKRVNEMQSHAKKLDPRTVQLVLTSSPASEIEEGQHHLSTMFLTYEVQVDENGKVNYLKPTVVLISQYAKVQVLRHVLGTAFDKIVYSRDKSKASYFGAVFEDLVCAHFVNGGSFDVKALDDDCNWSKREFYPAKPVFISTHEKMRVEMERILPKRLFSEGSALVAQNAAVVGTTGRDMKPEHSDCKLYVAPVNFPGVDFVDDVGRLFNATLNKQHHIADKCRRELSKLMCSTEFYWCVPDTARYKDFKGHPFGPYSSVTRSENNVKQYVLKIPRDPNYRCDVRYPLSRAVVSGLSATSTPAVDSAP